LIIKLGKLRKVSITFRKAVYSVKRINRLANLEPFYFLTIILGILGSRALSPQIL